MWQNTLAQSGYPSRNYIPSGHSVIVPSQPEQNYPQHNNPNFYAAGIQPIINFSIHFDPLISWFSTNNYDTHNDGVVPGFNFGLSYNRYFRPNYSFSSGINIINAGGRLISKESTYLDFKNSNSVTVPPGVAVTYKITYISIPLGIKLQTSQIGHGRFFTDLGFDPKILVSGRANIPSLDIKGGNAMSELNMFNLSFHVTAGMEYPLSPNNDLEIGMGFDHNLFDTTSSKGYPSSDMVYQKSLSFRIGITF